MADEGKPYKRGRGRPAGSKNKKTLEKERMEREKLKAEVEREVVEKMQKSRGIRGRESDREVKCVLKQSKGIKVAGHEGTFRAIKACGQYTMLESEQMGQKAYNIILKGERIFAEDVNGFRDPRARYAIYGDKALPDSVIKSKEMKAHIAKVRADIDMRKSKSHARLARMNKSKVRKADRFEFEGSEYSEDDLYDLMHDRVGEEEFDEMLDDAYGSVDIAGGTYDTSYALRQVSPYDYELMMGEYIDSLVEDAIYELNNASDGETIYVGPFYITAVEEDEEDMVKARKSRVSKWYRDERPVTVGDLQAIIDGILKQIEGKPSDTPIVTHTTSYGSSGYYITVDGGIIDYMDIEFEDEVEKSHRARKSKDARASMRSRIGKDGEEDDIESLRITIEACDMLYNAVEKAHQTLDKSELARKCNEALGKLNDYSLIADLQDSYRYVSRADAELENAMEGITFTKEVYEEILDEVSAMISKTKGESKDKPKTCQPDKDGKPKVDPDMPMPQEKPDTDEARSQKEEVTDAILDMDIEKMISNIRMGKAVDDDDGLEDVEDTEEVEEAESYAEGKDEYAKEDTEEAESEGEELEEEAEAETEGDESEGEEDEYDMDIEKMIANKRAEKADPYGPPVGVRTQPFANNYRTVVMGEGKSNPLTMTSGKVKRVN